MLFRYPQQPSAERSASKPILQEGLMFNQTVYVGQYVTFRCRVSNDAHPHMQWLFKSTNKTDGNDTSDYKVLKVTTSVLGAFGYSRVDWTAMVKRDIHAF